MPWYKIEANHGPGHQSHGVYYEWMEKPTKQDKIDVFHKYFGHTEWPEGSVRAVSKLPPKIAEQLANAYKTQLDHYKRLLRVLSKTPTKKSCNTKSV
jgi:hypothetical protein